MSSPVSPRPVLALLLGLVLVVAGAAGPASAELTVGRSGGSAKLAPSPNGRYLVQYASDADLSAEAWGLRARGLKVRATEVRSFKAAVVTASRDVAASLAGDPDVVAIEPDVRVRTVATQDNAPWGLDRVDQRALPLSRTYTPPATGGGVNVYVMDTGVLAAHREFGGRVTAGWSAISDGLGSSDCNGHGTHVAGTVAGSTYGVAKDARIIPVRVLGCDGSGWGSDLVNGLEWIARDHAAGVPAVLNMSLGGDSASSVIDSAVQAVINDGVTAVVAAGNATKDACSTSPARVTGAVTVAATDENDRQASFSNYGSCVDLYAPGVRIVSASHRDTTSTASFSGTSMAAPHVAGAAAILLSQRLAVDPVGTAAELSTTATPGVVVGASTGTPNRLLHIAVAEPGLVTTPEFEPNRPGRATDVRAAPRRRAALVTWVQGDDGGSALTRQLIRVYRGTQRVATLKAPGNVTAALVTGLRPGKVHRFSVIAQNAAGKSAESRRSNKVRPRN